jgi:putative transposase
MPWKERRTMGLKLDFVEKVEKGATIAGACREHGITRTTGHKWWKRYKEGGYAALDDESRRPKSAPLATAEDVVMAVLEARESHSRWGPVKLAQMLHRKLGEQTPSERTIARILKRAHKVRERRKRRPLSVIDHAPEVEAPSPNDIWSVDFKGWWLALNGDRCEPLTIRDACSRFLLAANMCGSRGDDVRSVFEALFRRYGLPKAIQCDNGAPFISSRSRAGLSRLSAWWISLGIAVVRSRPGCPQDNGAHERMHADIAGDLQVRPATDHAAQQRALDRWRQEFNHVRPHQALGGRTPGDVYKVEEKRKPAQYVYPPHLLRRRVTSVGAFSFGGDPCPLGLPFAGLEIGIERFDRFRVRVWLCDVDLGFVDTLPLVSPDYFETSTQPKTTRATKGAKTA